MRLSLFAFLTVFLLHCTIAVPILPADLFKSGVRKRPGYTRMSSGPTTPKPPVPSPSEAAPDKLILYHIYEFPAGGLNQVHKGDIIYEHPNSVPIFDPMESYVMYMGEDEVTKKSKLVLFYPMRDSDNNMVHVADVRNLFNPKGTWIPKEYHPFRQAGKKKGHDVENELKAGERRWKERKFKLKKD